MAILLMVTQRIVVLCHEQGAAPCFVRVKKIGAYEYLYLVENALRFSPARQPEAAPDRDDHGPIGRTADRS